MQSGRVKFQVCRRFEALWAVLARKPLTPTINSSIINHQSTIINHQSSVLAGEPLTLKIKLPED